MSQQTIMIYGGAFDPFHNGHASMIDYVIQYCNPTVLLITPTYRSPLKDHCFLNERIRIKVIEAWIKNYYPPLDGRVQVNCFMEEIKKKSPSYTIDTIYKVRKMYPNKVVKLLIGSDQFFSFHLWKSNHDILNSISLYVLNRHRYYSREEYQSYWDQWFKDKSIDTITFLQNPLYDISSTKIREHIDNQDMLRKMVPRCTYMLLKGI